MASTINVLLETFPGLGLASTTCLPLPASSTTAHLLDSIRERLPQGVPQRTRLLITAPTGAPLVASSSISLADFVPPPCWDGGAPAILRLRLSVPLVGGKGGFGSQLRAAGGRMSSRKKKQNAELAMGSARNLDGRRLRTITEAKNLATYLATRPEMDRKEKEERRKRWEQVIELAERREADMRAGKGADGRKKGLSDEWMEEKEEVGESVKNAVKKALLGNPEKPVPEASAAQEADSSGSGGSAPGSEEDSDDEDPMELDESDMSRLRTEAEAGDADALWVLKNRLKIPTDLLPKPKTEQRRFAGFDDDEEEYLSSDEEADEDGAAVSEKGKQKIPS